MLKHTFCHVPGIGLKTERRLWDNGVLDWDTPLGHVRVKRTSAEAIDALLDASREKLSLGEPAFFSEILPPKESWRIFPDFRDSVAYIDIETNGYMGPHGYITAISLYDGKNIRYYVKGENLDRFMKDIMAYKLLVTYNGKCFDIPFIESHLGVRLPHAHIDLMYVLRDLGFRGGLKGGEKMIGIDRGGLDGVDGYFEINNSLNFYKTSYPGSNWEPYSQRLQTVKEAVDRADTRTVKSEMGKWFKMLRAREQGIHDVAADELFNFALMVTPILEYGITVPPAPGGGTEPGY